MKDLSNLLKTPLYRILFNFPIGVIAFVILNYVFNDTISLQLPIICQNIDNCTVVNHALHNINMHYGAKTPIYSNSSPSGDIYWLIYITLAILIGEVVSFIGEIPVNILFKYNPIKETIEVSNEKEQKKTVKDSTIELITPETNQWIYYSDFNNDKETSFWISELHFSMSRMLAGFGFEMYLALGLSFFGSASMLVVYILIYVFLIHLLQIFISKDQFAAILLIVLLFICVISLIIFPSFYYNFRSYGAIYAIIFQSSYIASVYYRAHANKLLAASRR
ncbi:hypothetical protein [Hippea sp. KM1]|uniref:hypothetical protein n=1 Tax=Hippea sp. KM1 TaxID=944481 RepID=UPI00046CDFF5|nr:hypothetical protein [Hippea sp. KM1]